MDIDVKLSLPPLLDPGFVPAFCWNRTFKQMAGLNREKQPFTIQLLRRGEEVYSFSGALLPLDSVFPEINIKYVERATKGLLWAYGANEVRISGADEVAAEFAKMYSPDGERAFDYDFVGRRIYSSGISVKTEIDEDAMPAESDLKTLPHGGHREGCRVGLDLGGSFIKIAAAVDGNTVFSQKMQWTPLAASDPEYHYKAICEAIALAASKLPRLDAIGISTAGVVVDNSLRVSSLFRGVQEDVFNRSGTDIFKRVAANFNDAPLAVANDGDVTALSVADFLGKRKVLGISMGSSMAGGYVDAAGNITSKLNELAFVPVDYRDDAFVDEWSGDKGCGVQYFSQQAVSRLAKSSGMRLSATTVADRSREVQMLAEKGDEKACGIYRTMGMYLGYSIPHYGLIYDIEHVALLGGVLAGASGNIICSEADSLMKKAFPSVAEKISIILPGNPESSQFQQAITAAYLPNIKA